MSDIAGYGQSDIRHWNVRENSAIFEIKIVPIKRTANERQILNKDKNSGLTVMLLNLVSTFTKTIHMITKVNQFCHV